MMRGATFLIVVLLVAGACGPALEETGDEYITEIETWRADREERLRAEDGWLSLVALVWLQPGRNDFGSGTGNEIRFPEGTAPGHAGTLILDGGEVRLEPGEGVDLLLNGEPAANSVLATDATGKPDVVKVGDLSFHIIVRGERIAVRAKHPGAPTRTGFEGLEHFDIDPAYRVTGTLVRYRQPREIPVPTVLGTEERMLAPGVVEFTLHGETLTLVPLADDPEAERFFVIFRDGTSGKETYPGGRFLTAVREGEGIVLDFNRAYNPPCAFTKFATCPLPPRENRLEARIEAGEKYHGRHPEGE
jgi:hypothetical protein